MVALASQRTATELPATISPDGTLPVITPTPRESPLSKAAKHLGVALREVTSRYAVVEHTGEGGMGAVYVAIDTALGREVALKVMHRDGDARRFAREARMAAGDVLQS